ncbi:MAG: hypothetical protein IKJ27_10680 [Clostridia bacterium]|nr:hypothetical protein [Clostridia bacterium]
MELSKYNACICEGTAEQVIIDLLLDNSKLIFSRNDLLEHEILRCRTGKNFEEQYLRKGFTEQITVFRILDSRRENFKLSKAYQSKVKVVNIITAPEIEMLVILNEGKYSDYKKSGMKPSVYCKSILKHRDVKSAAFVKSYFKDIDVLIKAIIEYKRVSNVKRNEFTLADILK